MFDPSMPSEMGAVAEALRVTPGAVRSWHPQVSVAAVGAKATQVVHRQSLAYGVGSASPFGTVRDLGGRILLIGVGHNRNTFLHHAEGLVPHHRLKVRRFPILMRGERVWVEIPDVADDLDTYFPTVGGLFEDEQTIDAVAVGATTCRLLEAPAFVTFAAERLAELLPRQ